ncbi:hypothetical protein PAMA_005717 [Pampus argenteus]
MKQEPLVEVEVEVVVVVGRSLFVLSQASTIGVWFDPPPLTSIVLREHKGSCQTLVVSASAKPAEPQTQQKRRCSGRACTSTQRSVDMVQLSHGPEVLTPTFVGHIHPLPPSEDRSPLSRALNPPQSAPLQHINSGTGTNCPTLDVLETQIASAASAPQTPPTLHPKQKKTFKRRIAKLQVSLPGLLACALNCELQCGCKVVSSTRLLLFTLSRLPSPRLHSASPQFKETLNEREAA